MSKSARRVSELIECLDLQADPETLTVVDPAGWAWRRGLRNGDGTWREVENAWDTGRDEKPRILAITPLHPSYGVKPQTWASIEAAITAYDGPIDWVVSNGDNPKNIPFANVTYQHNKAREMALNGDYDALLSIESDMVVPEDTVQRLIDAGGDITYGLYVWRWERIKNRWNAYTELTLWGGESVSLDHTGETARRAWGTVMDVVGLGMGCTLIRRNVLERIPFRLYDGDPDDWLIKEYADDFAEMGIEPHRPRRSMLCDDWFLALDAQHHGFTQRCDLGLVCGHVHDGKVLWPDPDAPKLYRKESINEPVYAGRGE